MAKCKYDPKTFPLIALECSRDGMPDRQIAETLGIAEGTLYSYINKYSEFSNAIRDGRKPITATVENSLLNRANGIRWKRTKITKERVKVEGDDGKKEWKMVVTKEEVTDEFIPPDLSAIKHWLHHKKGEVWGADESNVDRELVIKVETKKDDD